MPWYGWVVIVWFSINTWLAVDQVRSDRFSLKETPMVFLFGILTVVWFVIDYMVEQSRRM
ncbi:MAG: hypothetical protein CMI53_00165 [Parcubacteria group bacterium]|jgi:hypothetical protein|nr:hypothetical protein [Parcubacteria group bacterium]